MTKEELIEAIEDAIDALDFYAGPNCWGDPNIAQQTAEKLRALVWPEAHGRRVLIQEQKEEKHP